MVRLPSWGCISMSLISKLSMFAAAGASTVTAAEMGTQANLSGGNDGDVSSICRIGDTDTFCFVYQAQDTKRLYAKVITFTPSNNSFSIGGEQDIASAGHSSEPVNPTATWDSTSNRVVCSFQKDSYYPGIFTFSLSGNSVQSISSVRISNDSSEVHSRGNNFLYDSDSGKYVGVLHKVNSGTRAYAFTVSSNGSITINNSPSQITGGAAGFNKSDLTALVYDGTTYHYFNGVRTSSGGRHCCFTFNGSSFANEDGLNSLNLPSSNRFAGAMYLPTANKVVSIWNDEYTAQNTWNRKIRFYTPTTSGARLSLTSTTTLDSSLVGWSTNAQIESACFEPVSEGIMLFEQEVYSGTLQVNQVVVSSSGGFQEIVDLGTNTNGGQINSGSNIAPTHDDDFSILAWGHASGTNYYARTIRGQS